MRIICTGMDNTGKTTLSEQLSKDLNLPIIKSCGNVDRKQQESWLLKHMFDEAIFDRFPLIEELVYGHVLRGDSRFDPKETIFNMLGDMAIVYTRPTSETILDFGNREQMEGVINNAEDLLKRFDYVINELTASGYMILHYNYNNQEEYPSLLATLTTYKEMGY